MFPSTEPGLARQLKKEKAYRSLVSRTSTRSRHSSDTWSSYPVLKMSEIQTNVNIPVVKLKEGEKLPKPLRRQHSIAELNNNRGNYKNFCHYRMEKRENSTLPPIESADPILSQYTSDSTSFLILRGSPRRSIRMRRSEVLRSQETKLPSTQDDRSLQNGLHTRRSLEGFKLTGSTLVKGGNVLLKSQERDLKSLSTGPNNTSENKTRPEHTPRDLNGTAEMNRFISRKIKFYGSKEKEDNAMFKTSNLPVKNGAKYEKEAKLTYKDSISFIGRHYPSIYRKTETQPLELTQTNLRVFDALTVTSRHASSMTGGEEHVPERSKLKVMSWLKEKDAIEEVEGTDVEPPLSVVVDEMDLQITEEEEPEASIVDKGTKEVLSVEDNESSKNQSVKSEQTLKLQEVGNGKESPTETFSRANEEEMTHSEHVVSEKEPLTSNDEGIVSDMEHKSVDKDISDRTEFGKPLSIGDSNAMESVI